MKSGECNKAKGVGVDYKKNVSIRTDRIGGHADKASVQGSTTGAFNAACKDTKKA
jgi:hypothetical protein